MLELIVFGLLIACAVLFQRVVRAEQRIGELEESHREHTWRLLRLASREGGEAAAKIEPAGIQEEPAPVPAQTPVPVPVPAPAPAPAVTLRSASDPVVSRDAIHRETPPEPDPVEKPTGPRFTLDFEDIFGRRLPIWAGGITLAVAGVFLVRYSIEAGLLTPTVRVALSFLFGIGLLASAEAAYRFEDRVGDERVRQALAGAGLATLYAAFYLAGTQYALIGQTLAFLGLAGVTALAIFLSFRFGVPSAVLGLVGGFAAPALVGGEDANLPMLALYLALVTGGLTQTANRQRRSWLGLGALAGGLGWGALLLIGGNYDYADILALGLYFIALGTLLPAVLDIERFRQPIRLAAAGAAGLQLAVLVDKAGYQPLAWGLYLLLGGALAWLGWRRADMRAGNAMAAAIGIALLSLWPAPAPLSFALVAAGLAALFAGVPLALLYRKDAAELEAFSIAAVPLAIGIVLLQTYGSFDPDVLRLWDALGLLALAALPAAGAWLLWQAKARRELAANLASTSLLVFFASVCLLPDAAMPFAASAIALGLVWLLRERVVESSTFTALLWFAAFGTGLTLLISDPRFAEIQAMFEGLEEVSPLSLFRWLASAAPFAAIALVERGENRRPFAEFLSGMLVFAALAQVLPPIWLVWSAAALAVAIRFVLPERSFAGFALIVCIGTWALGPFGDWLTEALTAMAGRPMLVSYMPGLRDVLGFILPLVVALGASRLKLPRVLDRSLPLAWTAAPLGLVVVHVLFKQMLHIDSGVDFELGGLAERTLWQALLLGAGWAFYKGLANKWAASVLVGTALAHFLYFTVLLHNPLWAHQAVGQVPVANLGLAGYAIGVGALLSLRLWWPKAKYPVDVAIMLLVTLGAMTLLRQIFAGSFLDTLPMSQNEDLLRSLIGILVAIAFLLIGSARGERLWRLGSLVLMTLTVLKVFIVDTAGLEGLLRVASFVALGASLIGIGWFYSRQLKAAPVESGIP